MRTLFFIFFIFLFSTLAAQRHSVFKILQTDSVHFDYDFVDLQSVEIIADNDVVIFELTFKSLQDQVDLSWKNSFDIDIHLRISDSTYFSSRSWCICRTNKSQPLSIMQLLSDSCRFISHESTIRNSIEYSEKRMNPKVVIVANKLSLEFSKSDFSSHALDALKSGIVVYSRYNKVTPSCEKVRYADYLVKEGTAEKYGLRGLDSVGCSQKYLHIDYRESVILPFRQIAKDFKKHKSSRLSKQERLRADSIFEACFAGPDINRYKRQYVPMINEKGEKEIFINAFCGYLFQNIDITKDIVTIWDAGSCNFTAIMNLRTRQCYDVSAMNSE